MENNKEYSMKKSLRNPDANKATAGKSVSKPPLPSHIMRESMIFKSTSAARAAGLSQMNTLQDKPLPALPPPQPQSSSRTAIKGGPGRGRLAHGTMRKPIPAPTQRSETLPIGTTTNATDLSGLHMSKSGRRREGPSYPPSAWKPLAQSNRDTSRRKPLPMDAGWRSGPEMPFVVRSESSDGANNDTPHKVSRQEPRPVQDSRWARRYSGRGKEEILQITGSSGSIPDKRPQTAGARILTKLTSWSRASKGKYSGQRRPNTADDVPVAIPNDISHWGPFRAAVEKVITLSRPGSREQWPPVISHPIDIGQVFAADIVEKQEQMPRTYSSWIEAQLAKGEDFVALERPRDADELHNRDTQASMESRMTQMADFIEQYSRLKKPAPRPGLISKLARPRLSLSHSQPQGNNESSPLEFACCGEWVDPEPDYDPFKELDEVLTHPERPSSSDVPSVGLGIDLPDRVSAEVDRADFSCPRCRRSGGFYAETCSGCGSKEDESRRSVSPSVPTHVGTVESSIPNVTPNRLSIYSQYPSIYSGSNSSPPKSGPSRPHSIPRRESYFINVDLNSLAGAAYHEARERTGSSSPAISSVYSVLSDSAIHDDPGNPFVDQRAVDAYREAMNRWHPPTSQVAPLTSGTSSFAQHRERVREQQAQASLNASLFNQDGHLTPPAKNSNSNPSRESVYTLSGHADDEMSTDMYPVDSGRETWMTLNTSYQPGLGCRSTPSSTPLSRDTRATTVSDDRPKHSARSFASRAAASEIPIVGPGPRSISDKRWPYSPDDSESPAHGQGLAFHKAISRNLIGSDGSRQDSADNDATDALLAYNQRANLERSHAYASEGVRDTALYDFYDDLLTSSSEENVQMSSQPRPVSRTGQHSASHPGRKARQ